jgi:hypothetical protein
VAAHHEVVIDVAYFGNYVKFFASSADVIDVWKQLHEVQCQWKSLTSQINERSLMLHLVYRDSRRVTLHDIFARCAMSVLHLSLHDGRLPRSDENNIECFDMAVGFIYEL